MPVKRGFTLNTLLIDQLYQKNGRIILVFVQRQVGSLEEAEDIVLDVFIAALESNVLSRLDEANKQAWLYQVARNKCVDHLRRTARRPVVPLDTLIESIYEDDEREPDKIAMRQEEYTLLHTRLTLLTEQQQEILRLKFSHGLRSPEIAKRMNKSESAVRMMLSRTLNFLRDIYTNADGRRER